MTRKEVIYLDYAAATPIDAAVLAAMQPYFSEWFYNPSSPYLPAVEVRREYDGAKQRLAATFGAKPGELIMTAGATESVNLAFNGIGGHVVISNIEHQAVLAAAGARDHTLVAAQPDGRIKPKDVIAAIRDDTELISIGLANSELGTIQPIKEIAALLPLIRERRLMSGNKTPLHLHTDASQAFAALDVHVARLGVDMMTLSAAKIYGPKQVGLLWIKPSVTLVPVVLGGGQERGLRSGTENVAGVIGFAAAAELVAAKRQGAVRRLKNLRDDLQRQLLTAFPQAVVSGHQKHRLPGHLHLSFPGLDAERLIFLLEEKGVLLATGSACSANEQTRSHVLVALGLDDDVIDGSLRISLGASTTEADIRRAGEFIIAAVKGEYARVKKS